MNKLNFEQIDSYSLGTLKNLANKYRENYPKTIQVTFDNSNEENFEHDQKDKFHLERLNKSGYIEIKKHPHPKKETWKIKVLPKTYVYLDDIKDTEN